MTIKRALVTGGSGEIGATICRQLAADGLHIIVHANSRLDRAERLAGEIAEAGGSAEAVCFDVTHTDQAAAAISALLATAPIQILVSNAGVHDDAPMAGMSSEQWHKVIDVSLNGFYNVARPLLLPMLKTRWGRIVVITSVTAIIGNRGQTNYAAAKAGLHGVTKSLARECASRNVTVNAVAPGIVATRGFEKNFPPDRVKELVPMNRAADTIEVADLVAFLASDRAAYITGQIVGINGGMI